MDPNLLKGESKGMSMGIVILAVVGIIVVVFLFSSSSFTTGPTGGTVGPGNSGVVIKSFILDTPVTEVDSPVTFSLTVENKGEIRVDSGDITAKLYGLSSSEWNGASTSGTDFNDIRGPLAGIDTTSNAPGEIITSDLTVTPRTERNNDIRYDVSARVYYEYSTVTDAVIRVTSSDYARTVTQQGGQVQATGVTQTKTTAGPMTVAVRTRTGVLSPGSTSLSVVYDISNTGGGRNFYGQSSSLSSPTSSSLDWVKVEPGSGVTCTRDTVKLIDGKATISCTLSVSSSDVSGGYVNLPFTMKFVYNYFVDSATSVTVLKTPPV